MSTANFLGTLGTDTHMPYTDGNYVNVAQVIADLKYLGISQVRDGITNAVDANGNFNGSAPIATYLSMAEAGIKFTFIFEPTSSAGIQTELALINQVEKAVPGSITAIEGPNEINNTPVTFNGLTGQAGALAAQQALYAAVKADTTLAGVPVDYFTGYSAGSTDPTTTAGLANYDNQHPYPQYGEAPAFWVGRSIALTNLGSSDVATAPAVYTETGYSTGQVTADVQEQYTLDLVMDTAKDGISKTYLYDLLDGYSPGSVQGDDGFGLFDYTGAAKPAAAALHNLTTLLQDTGTTAASFTPGNLTYTISGLPSTGDAMVFEKSNGTYMLAVWAEPEIFNNTTGVESASPSENVTVTLPQAYASIEVFDPTTGLSARATSTNSNTVTVAVTDHPILIELGAAAATSVAPPSLTIAKPAQVANTTEVVLSGTVTDTTATSVQVKDGSTVLGAATVSNGSWSYTSANLTAGSHSFSAVATDQAGNTATASDAAFTITAPALSVVYNAGVDTSTTTRTASVTAPITVGGTGNSTIVLAISEDAYLGDAQFTVSVDGVQIGGVQTATALHSAGASQNFTLLGNFAAGTHTVSVNFLNDAAAVYSNNTLAGDRNLYVNSITSNGKTTVENVEQNLAGSRSYAITLPAASTGAVTPTIAIASQVLTQDTGASATDDITSNGAVTLTGTVTGANGTVVTLIDGSTVLGSAAVASGKWSYTTTLAAGTHALHAVATDPSGNTVASAAEPSIIVDKTAPVIVIKTPVAVANTTEVVLSGTVTDATAASVQVKDGSTVLGTASVSNGSWSYTSADLTAGSHSFSAVATDLAGNTSTVSEAAFTIAAPALKIVYSSGVDTSTTTRSASVVTPVTIGGTGSSTIVLAVSEDAYLGDAQFTVSVDGVQIGGVQTATALHSAGASQNFSLLGNFTAGAHTVSVNFLNDAAAVYSNNTLAGDRNLYVNSITANGVTSAENIEQNLAGSRSYTITLPAASSGSTSTSTPAAAKPTIAIASQVLTQDTGTIATDDVTSNGAVTLTGTVTGATGTAVTIVDGSTLLGSAVIASGKWTYSTTLAAGTHQLHAVATDPSGNTIASAAEPSIIVDKTAPVLTIATPVAVANTTEVVLSGTVTDATATSVQVKDGSTVLGAATVSNGSWSYTSANLTAGSHDFSAMATDLAGNTSTASDAAFTVTTPVTAPVTPVTPVTTTPDELLATVSTGSGTTQQEVDLSSATPINGTYVPVSTSGIGTNALVLYNWNPATQLQGFLAAQKAGTASIVGLGDSWTNGFGSATTGWSQLSYLNEMTQALKADGVAAQSDNFLGSEFYITNGLVDDNRLTPVGYPTTSTFYDGGFSIVAGGNAISLASAGKGFDFQLDTPGNYNEVTLSYIDQGSGSVSLTVDGVAVGNMSFGNTGETLTQTIKIPAGNHSDLVVKSTSANPVYIQGASFSSTTNPAISVYNAGIGGWDSGNTDTSIYNGASIKGSANGFGETASAAALKPSLALIDLGSNDIAGAEDTTAQSLANIEQIVATLQSAGTDVIIMIPQPFGSDAYATELPALRAGLEAYSTANNVPLIDLSATYGDSEADLEAAGLKSDLLHGDATFYADIGSKLAGLLTQTIDGTTTADTVDKVVKTNSLLSAAATSDTTNIVLSSAAQTVARPAGNVLIKGTAAQAGAKIIGTGEASTRFEITGGGKAVLNAADTQLTVKLDGATDLTLSPMQFITADGSAGGSTITALAINQTLLGGTGDTLIGAAAFGDLFKGSAADLSGDIIKNFGGSDQIDVTDLLLSKVTGISWTAKAGGGVLSLADGTHSTALSLVGNYTSNSFKIATDGATGTRVTLG